MGLSEQNHGMILVVSEDDGTRTFLCDNLTADRYLIQDAVSCQHAIVKLRNGLTWPDAIVADVNGGTNELLGFVAGRAPVLCVGHPDEVELIRRLEAGAADCVGKPFSYPELRARVGALVRRPARNRVLRAGPLVIDLTARTVSVGDTPIPQVTRREFALLAMLAQQPTRVFTKEELLKELWGVKGRGTSRTLDSHACRLRAKLTTATGERFIANVWGVGYRLLEVVAEPEPTAA